MTVGPYVWHNGEYIFLYTFVYHILHIYLYISFQYIFCVYFICIQLIFTAQIVFYFHPAFHFPRVLESWLILFVSANMPPSYSLLHLKETKIVSRTFVGQLIRDMNKQRRDMLYTTVCFTSVLNGVWRYFFDIRGLLFNIDIFNLI